jgi:hypothetical protein
MRLKPAECTTEPAFTVGRREIGLISRVEDGRGGCALRSPLRFLSPQADILAGLSNELSSSDPRGRLERKVAEPKHEPL